MGAGYNYAIAQPLEAHWDFNGNGSLTTLTDVTGYGHDGTVYNCASVPGCDGNPYGALEFFGAGSYVQVPSSLSFCMNEWTINAVVKVNAFNNNPATCQWSTILSHDPRGTNNYYSLDVGNMPTWGGCTGPTGFGQGLCASAGGGISPGSVVPVNLGQWYCFTAINRPSGSTNMIELYINGVLVTSYPWFNTFVAPCGPFDLFFGKGDYGGFNTWFTGAIDDIQIYRNAVPASMVPVYFPCPCSDTGGPNPNDCHIDDINYSSSYYSPYMRSFTANVTPAYKWVKWVVNGTPVTAMPSTSPFTYTFPGGGTYTVCGYVFDPYTRQFCDSLCFETCITEHGNKPGHAVNDHKALTPKYPNNGVLEKTVDKPSVGQPYPNPADEGIYIPINGYKGAVSVAISTPDGKRLSVRSYSLQTGSGKLEISIKELPPGTYFISVGLGNDFTQKKFTKL